MDDQTTPPVCYPLVKPKNFSSPELLYEVLPNLRDLAISSGLAPKMKEGMLYRSARHFATSHLPLKHVLCDMLDIRSVIDLRDDDLTPSETEMFSRVLLMQLFRLQMPSRMSSKTEKALLHLQSTSDEMTQREVERLRQTRTASRASSMRIGQPERQTEKRLEQQEKYQEQQKYQGSGECSFNETSVTLRTSEIFIAVSHKRSASVGDGCRLNDPTVVPDFTEAHSEPPSPSVPPPALPRRDLPSQDGEAHSSRSFLASRHSYHSVDMHAFMSASQQPLVSQLAYERQFRRLYILNVLNSAQIKERVMSLVTTSYAFPLLLAAKVADKVSGSALAPYYFCKYLMSTHDLIESYYEMIKHCRKNFCQVLKMLTILEVPILFHCTLGKDRTGLVAILVLSILGASDDGIIQDYAFTAEAGDMYQAFNYDFIVNQSGLPAKFAAATPDTAREVLRFIRHSWGSIDGYLDSIGFDSSWRNKLRQRYLVEI